MGGVSFPGQPAGVSRCHAEGYAAFFTLGIHNFRSYLRRQIGDGVEGWHERLYCSGKADRTSDSFNS